MKSETFLDIGFDDKDVLPRISILPCALAPATIFFYIIIYFSPEESVMVAISMKKLGCVTRLNEYIDLACDTSFIYWHRLVISVYFEHLFETKVDAYRINVSLII